MMFETSSLSQQDARPDLVCKHCGGSEFWVGVIIIGEGWCDAAVEREEDGKLEVEVDGPVRDTDDVDPESITEVGCSGCDKRVSPRKLDNLIGPRYEPKVGDRVLLPDGLEAVVEEVLPARMLTPSKVDQRVWVRAAGREFTTGDLETIPPNPDQLDLLEMARAA